MAHISRRSLLLAPFIAAGAAVLPKLSFKDWWSKLLHETFYHPTGWRAKILALYPEAYWYKWTWRDDSSDRVFQYRADWSEIRPVSQEEPSDHRDV